MDYIEKRANRGMLMLYTRDDENPRLWTADPDMLTLEQAIKILNPDALRQPMALKRGAYKKLITEFRKTENKEGKINNEKKELKFAMSGIKQECEPVKEEYLTWEEVKRTNTTIKVELPNGENAHISWSDGCIYIYPKDNACVLSGTIYSSRVFNALKLKRVE